eukprot:5276276-Pleurochrysis_carterae.AAC.1
MLRAEWPSRRGGAAADDTAGPTFAEAGACMHAYAETCMHAYAETCMHAYAETCMHAEAQCLNALLPLFAKWEVACSLDKNLFARCGPNASVHGATRVPHKRNPSPYASLCLPLLFLPLTQLPPPLARFAVSMRRLLLGLRPWIYDSAARLAATPALLLMHTHSIL